MSVCSSCGATITWLMTKHLKSIPVDGQLSTTERFDPKKHVSHFATCPQASQHRKSKKP